MRRFPDILEIQPLAWPPDCTVTVPGSKSITNRALILAALLSCCIDTGLSAADTDPRLKVFAAQKRQQMEEFATKLHLDVPAEARKFFQAAEAGDWMAVSNCFERLRPRASPTDPPIPLPCVDNVLFMPILETFGAYEQFQSWDGTMLQNYATGILRSLAPGDIIYVGGLNPGVFVLRAVCDVAQSPNILIVSLDGLQDLRYTEHLHLMYGDRVWIPGQRESQDAFQQYVEEWRRRQQSGDAMKGASGMMGITSALAKTIFDHNKDKHMLYVEESYVIPWMYPYLEPRGLILRLNKEPLDQLDPAIVERDERFWNTLTQELLADSRFLENGAARKTFSKLRTAIAGVYVHRRMTDEAQAAFKEALQLCPTCPEPTFRFAEFCREMGHTDEALAVLGEFKNRLSPADPVIQQVNEAINIWSK